MKELNLTVGQKVWSIQLGECEVEGIDYNLIFPVICRNNQGKSCTYTSGGYITKTDAYPSIFESNPFVATTQLPPAINTLSENNPENKAELINAFCAVLDCPPLKASVKDIAKEKLQKLLESI